MRIRQTVKKAVALGTGALMLGATILGASAANVSDYPTAFIKDGKVVAKIVVGEKAQAIDIVGAIDIAADLQSKAVSKTTVTTSGTGVVVTGGKTKEVVLGGALTDFATLNKVKLPVLKDEKISWNDKDVDVKETLTVNGMQVLTSATDKEFGASPVLGNTGVTPIVYAYTISDPDMNLTKVGPEDATHDGNLKVEILGKSVEISNVAASPANSVTMSIASEYYLNVGDSVTVDGKKVTLKNVASTANTVSVDVDGVVSTVTATVKTVNGIKVQVESSFYDDITAQRSATLKIGDKITQTIQDGDSMELFGEPEKKADANWVWNIERTGDTKLVLGAEFNQILNSNTEPVKAIGEKLVLPNDYVSIYMDSLTATAAEEVTFEFKSGVRVDLLENGITVPTAGTLNNQNALVITAPQNDMLKVNVSGVMTETEVVYLIANGAAVIGAFDNSDNDIQMFNNGTTVANEQILLTNDQTDLKINYVNDSAAAAVAVSGELNIGLDGTITLATNIASKVFSVAADDTGYVSTDVVYSNLGTVAKDFDFLTNWGVIIANPEAQLDNEKFMITLPPEQVKVNVVVVGASGSASTTSGSVTTDKVNPVGVDFAVLDKDFTAGSANSIVVGGPCVNTVAARLMGNPTVCTEGFSEGEAKLAVFADGSKVALIVAGYAGADTFKATKALILQDLPSTQSATLVTTSEPKFK